ncbi:hypothetical protein J3A83DRAFT_4250536, partial [Scleroderma citrinum]
MALVRPLTLVNTTNAKWTDAQEKAINRDYPFTDLHVETADQYVVRTYLQFLWLPESIMPLNLFVPSLNRVQERSLASPHSPHPLHALLDPLLLSTRSSSAKYHVELPQILTDNGGAGEIEETMMWYALNYEKAGSGDDSPEAVNGEDALMMEEKWKNAWLERLERREVQLQILLYLLKLSLPGPRPPLPPVAGPPSTTGGDTPRAKTGKPKKEKPKAVIPCPTERLESFMDKLSTWQLISQMNDSQTQAESDKRRDWMQVFCEDIVEPQFKTAVPDLCHLLRSKLFPHSPFSDDAIDADTVSNRSPSPPTRASERVPAKTSKKHLSRSSSILSSTAGSELRARSRSLSVSLAQDASSKRSNSGASTTLKRALSREVSMSRTFKPRPNTAPKGPEDAKTLQSRPMPDMGVAKKRGTAAHGVTLVTATPTKSGSCGQPRSIVASESNLDMDFEVEDEEIWLPDSPPNHAARYLGRRL